MHCSILKILLLDCPLYTEVGLWLATIDHVMLHLQRRRSTWPDEVPSDSLMSWRYLKGVQQANEEEVHTLEPSRGAKISPLMPLKGGEHNPQAEMQISETFICLLCQFEPAGVLSFLQSQEAYRVQVSPSHLIAIPAVIIIRCLSDAYGDWQSVSRFNKDTALLTQSRFCSTAHMYSLWFNARLFVMPMPKGRVMSRLEGVTKV